MVLKELTFKCFHFTREWWSSLNWFLSQFLFWECVAVLKEMILDSFYIGIMLRVDKTNFYYF